MATFERTCEQCGAGFSSSRRQARFCGPTCRSRAHRGKPALAAVPDDAPAAESTEAEKPANPRTAKRHDPHRKYSSLEAQVRASLSAISALDTISGMAAVRIAEQIDRGGDSGSAVATLSKELSRLVGEAKVEAAPRNKDAADDLMARVNEKILRLVQ